MDPLLFLQEEFRSVERALNETLRHDYGPRRSSEYFRECELRLSSIRDALTNEGELSRQEIAAHKRDLSALGSRISLIERSHLGEFSWPFADTIRSIAEALLVERDSDGDQPPIVHVIAQGTGYHIVDEILPLSGKQRIVVVAFPRQLKHHVLLHAIFGHELGHIAYRGNGPGRIITRQVMASLTSVGVLSDTTQATAWLKRDDAPPRLKAELDRNPDFVFSAQSLTNWRIEVVCDLFGLILFGPSFAAAHRALLEPLCVTPDDIELNRSTHPPYSVRRRIVIEAFKILGWDKPVCDEAKDKKFFAAEMALIEYVTSDKASDWASVLTHDQLKAALLELEAIFIHHPTVRFNRPDRIRLKHLMKRIALGQPPIQTYLSHAGIARNRDVPTNHVLYSGWAYWLGRADLQEFSRETVGRPIRLGFLECNRLCDYAMLQQCAIDLVKHPPKPRRQKGQADESAR